MSLTESVKQALIFRHNHLYMPKYNKLIYYWVCVIITHVYRPLVNVCLNNNEEIVLIPLHWIDYCSCGQVM